MKAAAAVGAARSKFKGIINVCPLTAIQSEYHLMHRLVEDNGVLDTCRQLVIGFVPYKKQGTSYTMNKRTGNCEIKIFPVQYFYINEYLY